MLYTVLKKTTDKRIRTDPQSAVTRGEKVWKTLREARLWRDQYAPREGVFAILADWDQDTLDDKKGTGEFRLLTDTYKIVQLEEVIPVWIKKLAYDVAHHANDCDLLDRGYICPDYATPEQEEVFYTKHKDEVMFQLRCMISLAVFEELEAQGLVRGDKNAASSAVDLLDEHKD